jgi:hypothetical protein
MVRDIGFDQGAVLPRYGSYCLSGIPATVLSLLGLRRDRPGLPDDAFEGIDTTGVEKVVLFLFDGFGYTEWRRQESSGLVKLMTDHGRVTPITSVFPSTTSTALTTLATGLTPQEHGLIEWFMYLSELDMIIETLPFSPMGAARGDLLRSSADPRILFEGETIYSRMMQEGVGVHSFLPRSIAQSGYSSVIHGGTDVIPYSRASDLVVSLRASLEDSRGPAFFYVYWPTIDTVEHARGPDTEEARLEAGMISHLLSEGLTGRLDGPTARSTLFLASADHGQVRSPLKDAVMLDDYAPLVESLAISPNGRRILPWGGIRDLYLQVRDESVEGTKDFLSGTLGDRARVFRTSDLVESGLFGTGTPTDRFSRRVGNLTVLPSGTGGVWYRHPHVDPHEMNGVHGGLHRDEMTIPFAVMRGSRLAR